jgi:hypothetical protein
MPRLRTGAGTEREGCERLLGTFFIRQCLQPKWLATSPMKAVSRPIIPSDEMKHSQPPAWWWVGVSM